MSLLYNLSSSTAFSSNSGGLYHFAPTGGAADVRAACSVQGWLTLPAVPLQAFGLVRAVEELALEKLHGNDSKDEHKEDVDDEDIQHVLQGIHHTIKHGLQETPTKH